MQKQRERADAESAYATNNLHRVEPLLAKQFVTVDQIDQAKTLQTTRQQASAQARSQLALSQRVSMPRRRNTSRQKRSEQSHQQVQQAAHAVTTLEPLTAQRSDAVLQSTWHSTSWTTASSSLPLMVGSPPHHF